MGQNIKGSSVDISNNEIEAKYKVRALGNGDISSLSNQISIPIEALFFIPDAFTPNEDNINNLFEIKGRFGRVNDYNLTIYDRWGNRITEITDKTQSWDGKRNGTLLPLGSYLYDLKIGLNKGEIIRKLVNLKFFKFFNSLHKTKPQEIDLKSKIYIITFLLFLAYSSTYSQKFLQKTKIQASIGGIVSSDSSTPFLLRSNQYGLVPLKSGIGLLNFHILQEYDSSTP